MGIFGKDVIKAKNNNNEDFVDLQNDTFKSCKEMNIVNKSFQSCREQTFTVASMMRDTEDREGMSILEPDPDQGGEERGAWSNQAEFFLSCMAYAVGIGNVWRFPYKCYKNGGGVFLIPYITMLALAALPMFYMELAIGQFSQLGPNKVFGKLAPAFRGLGYGMLCVTMWVALYYNVIIAWAFFYTFASMTDSLAWAGCDNWFNSPDCFLPDLAKECEVGTTLWNNTCTPISLYCQARGVETVLNTTHCAQNISVESLHDRKSPAEEYFKRYMLLMDDDTPLDKVGSMNWRLAACLLLSWVVVMACLIKGVKSAGKVVWFTALFPYFVLVLLLIRGVTLPGAVDGINYFVSPDWEKLLSVRVSSRWRLHATINNFYTPRSGRMLPLKSFTPWARPSGG